MSFSEWVQLVALALVGCGLALTAAIASAPTGYGLPVGLVVGGVLVLVLGWLIERKGA